MTSCANENFSTVIHRPITNHSCSVSTKTNAFLSETANFCSIHSNKKQDFKNTNSKLGLPETIYKNNNTLTQLAQCTKLQMKLIFKHYKYQQVGLHSRLK